MFFSSIVMFFIIITTGATLFKGGIININTAADAAMALRPFAGDLSYFLFAIGIIGTGLLAIPILAGSASYAISESFGWKSGLYKKLKSASAFYGVIIISMFFGIGMNFVGIDPIKALIYSAVLNGIISPVILFTIMRIGGSEEIMGENKNKRMTNFLGWFTVILLSMVSLGTIVLLLI